MHEYDSRLSADPSGVTRAAKCSCSTSSPFCVCARPFRDTRDRAIGACDSVKDTSSVESLCCVECTAAPLDSDVHDPHHINKSSGRANSDSLLLSPTIGRLFASTEDTLVDTSSLQLENGMLTVKHSCIRGTGWVHLSFTRSKIISNRASAPSYGCSDSHGHRAPTSRATLAPSSARRRGQCLRWRGRRGSPLVSVEAAISSLSHDVASALVS